MTAAATAVAATAVAMTALAMTALVAMVVVARAVLRVAEAMVVTMAAETEAAAAAEEALVAATWARPHCRCPPQPAVSMWVIDRMRQGNHMSVCGGKARVRTLATS